MNLVQRRTVIKGELERIYAERGRLTATDVLEAAIDETNPLHHFFEWDDSIAAEKHRLQQASGLIRSVKLTITRDQNGQVEDLRIRGWIAAKAAGSDTEAREGYLPEHEVREQPELREAVLRQMRREIQAGHTRYRHLSEYWELIDELAAERERRAAS